MFDRLIKLITLDNLEKIKNTKILLVGVGGVGGIALEALCRSGFQNITIIDGDKIDLTNLNRQVISNNTNIGKRKVEEAQKLALNINKDINIEGFDIFLTKDNFTQYLKKDYDYIIDACDDIEIKCLLIKHAYINNIKIISCLGTGRKLQANLVEITKLNKTFNDPLARKLRYMLKKEQIPLNIPVVFSREDAKPTGNVVGSAMFVPAVAGLYLANYVFNDIISS